LLFVIRHSLLFRHSGLTQQPPIQLCIVQFQNVDLAFMPKYLALEWDEHELRVATASQRGNTAVLERAFAVPLAAAEDKPHDAAMVAGVLREALAGESVRKIETLAVVGRPSIELKELSLPPAPDDELPDLVRFQAMRDFTQLSDDTPLDFIPLRADGEEHRNVLAAAISNDLLSEIRATCTQAGLDLRHLVLRPVAAASLLRRHKPAVGQVRMFVDLLGEEVDLTVLDDDSPLLMRTTRLPGDAGQPEFCRPVFLEIRRTIASVQNKLHGRRVESIWLCGDGRSQQLLADMVRSELELPTELFDPFTAFEQSGALRGRLPEHHSRYAPLLGMLADAAAGDRHSIDFLEPRRRPQAQTRRREATIAAVCIAALALIFVGWTWWRLKSLDDEIAELGRRGSDLDKQLKQNVQVEKEAAELDKWLAGDVPWLDVLFRLSTNAPKAEEVMLTGLKADVEKGGGGKLTLDVLAADSSKVGTQFEKTYPNTTRGTIDYDGKVSRYPWKFKSETKIDPKTIAELKAGVAMKTAEKPGVKPPVTKPVDEKRSDNKPAEPKVASPNDGKAVAVPPSAAKGEGQPKATDGAPAAAQPAPAVEPTASSPESKTVPSPAPSTPEKTAEKGS
jgi:Tfp pilus assembly PilM family ATPase